MELSADLTSGPLLINIQAHVRVSHRHGSGPDAYA